jgi:hypothetical protein
MDNAQQMDPAERDAVNAHLRTEGLIEAGPFELGQTVRFGDHLARIVGFETHDDVLRYQISVDDLIYTQVEPSDLKAAG